MAVTAPVCPRKTEIGSPSGKRHWQRTGKKITTMKYNFLKHKMNKEERINKMQEMLTTRMIQSFEEDATIILLELTARSVMSPFIQIEKGGM